MRDYQCKNTKYLLPRAVYHQTLWRIRDYYRLRRIADELVSPKSPIIDGMPHISGVSNPTGDLVERRQRILRDVYLIDEALAEVPKEYRSGIWNSIQFGQGYPDDATRVTYSRQKSKFIHSVAEKIGFL